jgi:hypothetical protein
MYDGYYGKITSDVYAAAIELRGDDDTCGEERVLHAEPSLVCWTRASGILGWGRSNRYLGRSACRGDKRIWRRRFRSEFSDALFERQSKGI